MLFDELTAALHPELAGEVLEVMPDLARSGMTLIVVSHAMSFVRDVADGVVFMAGGQIVERGPPAQLFNEPSHARLQAFPSRVYGGRCGGSARAERRERGSGLELVALRALAHQLAETAQRLGLLARPLLGRLLVVPAHPHLAVETLALHLLLQRAQGLIDIVVANLYLDDDGSPSGKKQHQRAARSPARCGTI